MCAREIDAGAQTLAPGDGLLERVNGRFYFALGQKRQGDPGDLAPEEIISIAKRTRSQC
jgi:hypothetical protein